MNGVEERTKIMMFIFNRVTFIYYELSNGYIVVRYFFSSKMTTPFFPGYDFRPTSVAGKQQRHKNQQLKMISGLMTTTQPDPSILDKQIEETKAKLAMIEQEQPHATRGTTFVPNFQPPDEQQSLVLRFYAYFQESVTESPDETYRVRYVRIYVYLEDDTIMIEEHKERNAGMNQGVLLRRMTVEHPNSVYGDNYTSKDFNIGLDEDICGVVYHIYDCDSFTRQYLNSQGIEVPPAESTPEDLYTLKRKLTDRPIRVSHYNADKTNLANFLKYDGQVLRFYAVWDDTQHLFGEKRKFVIIYFLVDGRIEIRQVLDPNSGRDPVARFLKKTLLKKPNQSAYYTDADLYIGQVVNAFGREFLIYDADDFTKRFLDDKYGVHDWTPITQKDPRYVDFIEIQPPPYNGWGDEQDSLGYVYSLHPKPPRKDQVKLLVNDGKILRFQAEFKNPNPIDSCRVFVVCYYQADDQVAVFEARKRNSGFDGGKFIQKGLYKNGLTGRYFKAQDFYVGAEIVINSYHFILTDADEFALNLMEADADEFPLSDLSSILTNCRGDKQLIEQLRKEFEAVDPDLTGYVPKEEATKKIVRILKLQLHEAITITRRFTDQKGFNYFQLFELLK